MESFGNLAFTDAVKAEQTARGSRDHYRDAYDASGPAALGAPEIEFLQSRTSIYIATTSETGWPYIQHRGGSAGFLRILGPTRIGFADYRGNRQYVSTGNLRGSAKMSIFAMDYPRRARLKLMGCARVIARGDDPETFASVADHDAAPAERVTIIDLQALDWNCPKYITPRFDQDEVTALVAPHLAARDRAIAALSARLTERGENPDKILKELENDPS